MRVRAIARSLLAAAALTVLIVGVPWALGRFIGWPLPDHLPSWTEIQHTVLAPMTPGLLLDILACLAWWIWALFVLDVIRCVHDAVHGLTWPTIRPGGPLRTAAAVLIGSLLLPLIGHRPVAPPAQAALATVASTSVVASATATPGMPTHAAPAPLIQAPSGIVAVAEPVRTPAHGVHDSLWRIADRVLHDGNRWPELAAINRGVVQADGRALTNPALIRPGWIITAFIPASSAPPVPDEQPSPPPSPPSPETRAGPTTPRTQDGPPVQSGPEASTTTHPSAANRTTTPTSEGERPGGGIALTPGAYVSIGLITAVLALLATVRMARRRRYRPGSGDRSDLARPIAPVVRAMRAHHDSALDAGGTGREEPLVLPAARPDRPATATPVLVSAGQADLDGQTDEGIDFAIDLATNRGTGLIGPGATAAARAMLVHLLARHRGTATRVLVAEPDLAGLGLAHRDQSNALVVLPTLDDVLDDAETELLQRTQLHRDGQPTNLPPLVLVATPAQHAERRMQNILDLGCTLGIAAILIGQWRPGATLRVRGDGTVAAASRNLGEHLTGARLYHLADTDTADLLTLLAEADVEHQLANPQDTPPLAIEVADSIPVQPTAEDSEPPEEPADTSAALPDAQQRPDQQGAAEPESDAPPWLLRVLGHVELRLYNADTEADLTASISPKHREILAFLAVHPDGVRREALNEALWPDSNRSRPYNALHNAMSTLRRRLADASDERISQLVLTEDGRYRLDRNLLSTDYDQLRYALAHPDQQLDVPDLFRGDLAEEVSAEWVEPHREGLRRDVLDHLSRRAREHQNRPDAALRILEHARALDPYNEALYREIVRTQAALGQYDAIERTIRLLRATLADIGQRPAEETINLARFLQRRTRPSGSGVAAS